MKMSRRAKRMDKRHKRRRSGIAINLVSLMDIFTILVFFLLVNSSDSQVPSTKSVELPESIAEKKPRDSVIVMVNDQDILVQGRRVASTAAVKQATGLMIAPLKEALIRRSVRLVKRRDTGKPFNGEVTIVGDKDIPFDLLKKIMVTCATAKYGKISLAVMQRSKGS